MNSQHLSAPYPPTKAALGLLPTVSVDVPICAIFLVLFIMGAVSHMTILQVNRRRGHKFLLSGMMFGFCMARITTMIMRIVWATRPTNVRIAIAANIFVAAGVVLLFVVNIVFAQRIFRACHPHSGWHPLFHHLFTGLYVLIVLTLLMLITSVIQSFYTLNEHTKHIDRAILLYGQTFYSVIAFLPWPMVLLGLVIPRKTRVEKFGQGRFRTQIAILLLTSFLLCLGACFRVGTNYAGGNRPINHPAAYQGKACFYIFNFTIEIIVILLYVVVRVDRRFWVSDHSKKAGDYSRGKDGKEEGQMEDMIVPEEQVFDKDGPEEVQGRTRREDIKTGVDEEKGPQEEVDMDKMSYSLPSSTQQLVPQSRGVSRSALQL